MKVFGIRRRYIFYALYVVIVLLTVIIGLRFVNLYFSSNSDTYNQVIYDKYYVMITDDNQSAFWQSVYSGAYEYGIDKNVYVEDLAASFSNELSKEELMRIAIASNVDGILVSSDESEEMASLIDEAMANNIPVVTLYNDSPNSSRISYVGVGNYSIGREYGEQALSVARDIYNSTTSEEISVTILVDLVPTSDQMMIYSTIQDAFDEDALGSRITLDTFKIDTTNTFSVEETIRDLFISEDTPDIVICLNELDTTCVYQAVIDYNKVGQVNILGYYDSDTILQGINRNIINSTIKVDAVQMGEYSVDALIQYGEVGFTSQYFAVDIDVINSYNIAGYMEETNNEK